VHGLRPRLLQLSLLVVAFGDPARPESAIHRAGGFGEPDPAGGDRSGDFGGGGGGWPGRAVFCPAFRLTCSDGVRLELHILRRAKSSAPCTVSRTN
jgi:hypothetical protein